MKETAAVTGIGPTSPRGVLYYNKGAKCVIRLLVSLWSLRRHYAGPVCVLWEGDAPPQWVAAECARLGADVRTITPTEDARPLVRKAQLWRWTPFDLTLFLDADTLILADPSPLFAEIEAADFMTYHFANWQTKGGKIARRINAWLPATGASAVAAALAYGPAVNTGIHGYRRGSPLLPAWEALTLRGWAENCTRRLVDELAAQLLLPDFSCRIVAPEWGASVRFGDPATAKIIHYHGSKHVLPGNAACALWKQAYWDYRNTSPAYAELANDGGDRRFRRYLRGATRPDVTGVTACSAGKYADTLAANWPKWMQTEGIRELQWLVFAHGPTRPAFLDAYRNVRVVDWAFREDDPTVSQRERMLSAFVFGAAREVKTRHWLKLDADARPVATRFDWPRYSDAAITGQRWGYTRPKGDPDTRVHWLNRLDAWYGGQPAYPACIPRLSRHGHARVNSFCCIESTGHTRVVAELCGAAGRLPVPSQDTTSGYVAGRLGVPVNRVNMRRYFKQ